MPIEDALYTRLTAVTALTDLVSTRIFPVKDQASNPTFPYITYQLLGSETVRAMGVDTGDVISEFTFNIWAKTTASDNGYDLARDVAIEVRGALQAFRGTVAGVEFKDVAVLPEADVGEAEENVYHRVIDFEIAHTR